MQKDTPPQTSYSTLKDWIFEQIWPYIKGRTIEIGSRANSFHTFFIAENRPIHLSDADDSICQELRDSLKGFEAIHGIHNIDLFRQDFEIAYPREKGVFDTVLSINPERESYITPTTIKHITHLLRTGGHFIFLASINLAFFSGYAPDWDDIKILNRPSINKFIGKEFTVLKVRYFDPSKSEDKTSFSPIFPTALISSRKL